MAYTNAISDIGATLVSLLSQSMPELGTEDIGLYTPAIFPDTTLPKLSLFLYGLNEDPNYVNREYKKADDTSLQDPGLALELFYMLIPNSPAIKSSDRALEEHKWLGHAMQVLRRNTVLVDPVLQGGLANKGLQIKITLNPVPLDDLTKIWQALQTRPFKLSICYRVGPVFIESDTIIPVSRVMQAITGQQ